MQPNIRLFGVVRIFTKVLRFIRMDNGEILLQSRLVPAGRAAFSCG